MAAFDRSRTTGDTVVDAPAEAVHRLPTERPDPDRLALLSLADLLDRGGLTEVRVTDHQVPTLSCWEGSHRATIQIEDLPQSEQGQEGGQWFTIDGQPLLAVDAIGEAMAEVTADQVRARMRRVRM